ncbi:MAG: GNAT family N-acetyltransferase [Bacteroidales bacterium]|nr:GNAT family N-acetyltransferase [Bacteroidales bacterium]
MDEITFRNAIPDDIPFLVGIIIDAEKSGTDKLTYSTIFGLSEEEVQFYLAKMLAEDIKGCELALSSFIVAEHNGIPVAALSTWIEGIDGIPSSVKKGNLIGYILPTICLKRAHKAGEVIQELSIEYIQNTIVIGAGTVSPEYRSQGLMRLMVDRQIDLLSASAPNVTEAYVQIYGHNLPSIKCVEKLGFKKVFEKESTNPEILNYLPSNVKVFMKKDIISNLISKQ